MDNIKGETFNEVMFVPQYSEVKSRSNISTLTDMGEFKLDLPLISSNMKDISGPKMVARMCKMGGLGILHRFGTIQESVSDFKEAEKLIENEGLYANPPAWLTTEYSIGVSVGVKEYENERFIALYDAGARLFTVDVAHGHHILVKEMIQFMRERAGKNICIIAGNVATPEGARDLREWGASIIKCGIGPGAACMTRRNTGVGVGQLKAIRDIRLQYPDMVIISDGGIKHYGDIPKALKYANAVMVGSLIAGTSETPGHVYENEDGEHYKVYGGSASGERKVDNGGQNAFVEGVVKTVKFKGKAKYILQKAKESIQTCISYSGADNLEDFRDISVLVDISSGSKSESKL